jgi:hypothetical protein
VGTKYLLARAVYKIIRVFEWAQKAAWRPGGNLMGRELVEALGRRDAHTQTSDVDVSWRMYRECEWNTTRNLIADNIRVAPLIIVTIGSDHTAFWIRLGPVFIGSSTSDHRVVLPENGFLNGGTRFAQNLCARKLYRLRVLQCTLDPVLSPLSFTTPERPPPTRHHHLYHDLLPVTCRAFAPALPYLNQPRSLQALTRWCVEGTFIEVLVPGDLVPRGTPWMLIRLVRLR